MIKAIRWYVLTVLVVAVLATAALQVYGPSPSHDRWFDAAMLTGLALAAEMLTVLLPRSALGSMGFIPYVSLALVSPDWTSVAVVASIRAALEIIGRRSPIKAVFNVAAHALMELAAVVVYLAAGGRGLLEVDQVTNVGHVTHVVGAPALLACIAALTTNNFLVTGAISFSTRRQLLRVWRENHLATIAIDLLAMPLVFVFAWVYAAFGPIMTATLWIPILGLRQLQRTNLELEKTNQELLELMVRSLEARDAYTSGHSRRVHHYSTTIARAIGLGDREVEMVGKAALLHDIGKIHEKYASVLAKADKLTPAEWALIQEHPDDGANLVATMSHLNDVVPAVRHHHENWDGTGYPHRLAGEAIPMASRIIRLADTIDAMTTERPYRAPLSEAQVRTEIIRCRGTQFDPDIADQLLSSALWSTLFVAGANLDPHRAAAKSIVLSPNRTAKRINDRAPVARRA
jgi:putative nucleotidyltransferase with HDIG domain